MTVVSVRGTHGSGKSTAVKTILEKYKAVPDFDGINKRPLGYLVNPKGERGLYVVGPYLTPCGGADAIQPYSLILPRILAAEDVGHDVLFEGALVSSSYGSIGVAMEEMEDPVFAFLNTPLAVCLERIAARRAAKGDFRPLDPKNTAAKYIRVERTRDQLLKLGSRIRVVELDYRAPVKPLMKLFGVNLAKEPK